MSRINFSKGKQREFIKLIMTNSNCPSLSELSKRILINYQTLKSYYHEDRLIPESLFSDFCYLGKVNRNRMNFKILMDNWGQVKGGKKGKRVV